MKQLVALVGLVFGFLVAAPGAYAQSCGGPVCNATHTGCQYQGAQYSRYCCCNVQCNGQGCTCTERCSTACAFSCTTVNCDTCGSAAPGEGFAYTPAVSDQVYAVHPLAAMVLSNVSNRGARLVGSQHVRGGSTLGNAGGYRYHADITADTARIVLALAFEQVGEGPPPEPQRIEIGQNGAVVTSPISPDEAQEVLTRVPPSCKG